MSKQENAALRTTVTEPESMVTSSIRDEKGSFTQKTTLQIDRAQSDATKLNSELKASLAEKENMISQLEKENRTLVETGNEAATAALRVDLEKARQHIADLESVAEEKENRLQFGQAQPRILRSTALANFHETQERRNSSKSAAVKDEVIRSCFSDSTVLTTKIIDQLISYEICCVCWNDPTASSLHPHRINALEALRGVLESK